ncbi:MAG TPA: class I SAM-dependent methyltransferase [Gaiellaceae bacterium]|jgi:SAM-dependent methyltransferase
MRWLVKAVTQKTISALPRAQTVNYVLQRHVSRSLPASEKSLHQKFTRAAQHIEAYEAHGPRRALRDVVFYEFGAGWDLAVQLSYWCLGVERQLLIDIRPNLRLELVNVTLERLRRLAPELGGARAPDAAPIGSPRELEERFGISYLAPRDARASALGTESVDFVTSTNTLEHIPSDDLHPILAECRRLLRPDGALSCRIDLRDHFAYFDSGLSRYNFLRYPDRTWAVLNSSLLYQNRLRRPDYLRAFSDAGFSVVAEQGARPKDEELEALKRLELAERFRSYGLDDLSVQSLAVVARPSPDAP